MVHRGLAVLVVALAWSACGIAAGQDFRVETQVFLDKPTEPNAESLTLFCGDVVYDFTKPQGETTVFDIRRGKLVLLDEARGIRTSLTTGELAEFSAAIKARGLQQGEKDLFEPQFETQFDEAQLRVTLASDHLTYSAIGTAAKNPEAAQRYRQFADWYARLNAMRPGNPPPFGRIELNKEIAERGLIPIEVERTVVENRTLKSRKIARSKHTVTWLISGTDQKRIDEAGHQLANLREVSPSEYWSDSVKTARQK
jgi:hypothetical protein